MTKRTIIPIVVWTLLTSPLVCAASAEVGNFDRALELIRDARTSFRVTTDTDLVAAKAEAAEKLRVLGGVLDASDKHGGAWKTYLQWDRLTAQLGQEAVADATELAELLDRFTRDHAGLELPAIMQLRAALERYYFRTLALGNDKLRDEFGEHLTQLSALVESLRTSPASETLQKIALQLAWFQQQEQAPDMVVAVRELAPVANVRLIVSQDFIAKTTREPIDRVDPLTDVVLGTTVHGTSHLVGTMAAVPVASSQEVRLEARLQGDADTEGRGYNGPVRANVVGTASVQATGAILFGPDGFRVGQTSAQVSATGRPTSMWSTCNSRIANRLVTNVAQRRAVKTQELGDCIASRHAEQRLQQLVGEELQTRLAELQHGYLLQFRNPLLRHKTFPRLFQATSQAETARVDMLLASPSQTGALQPPDTHHSQADLHAQIHETAVNNLATSLLAGRTVNELELREFFGRLFSSGSGEAGRSEEVVVDERDALQLVLADERPVTFQVDAGVITVKIRVDRFIRNRTRYPAMYMSVRYRIEQVAGGVLATQANDPEVVPQDVEEKGSRRLSAREIAARRLITSMLDRELAKTYQLGTFTLPEPANAYGTLAVTELTADNGWLDIGAQAVQALTQDD